MTRVLDRYVFRELVVPLIVSTVSVVLMFQANTLIAYSEYLFERRVPFTAVLQLLLFSIPSTLNLSLPVGATVASALAVSRLVRESELTAMRAAGIPIRRVLSSSVVMGLLVAGLSFYLVERVKPGTEAQFNATLRKVLVSPEAINVRTNEVIKLDNGRYHVSIGVIDQKADGLVTMRNVMVFHQPKRGEYWVATADTAEYKDEVITLIRPSIFQFEGVTCIGFEVKDKQVISERIGLDTFYGQPQKEEQTLTELRDTIRDLRGRGIRDQAREYEVEYQNRFSIPFACLVFALFAPVFALRFAKGGPFIGVLLSLIIVFLYYNFWVITAQILAKKGILSPLVGCWLPNAVFLAAALLLIWRSE